MPKKLKKKTWVRNLNAKPPGPDVLAKARMGARWKRLAVWLGVSVERMRTWREMPDAPQRPRKGDWMAFRDKQLNSSGEPGAGAGGITLKDKKLAAEIQLLEAKLAREQRKVVHFTDVLSLFTRLGTQVKLQLYESLTTEAPPKCAGRTAVEIRVVLKEMADDVCKKLSENIEAWIKEEDAKMPTPTVEETE